MALPSLSKNGGKEKAALPRKRVPRKRRSSKSGQFPVALFQDFVEAQWPARRGLLLAPGEKEEGKRGVTRFTAYAMGTKT